MGGNGGLEEKERLSKSSKEDLFSCAFKGECGKKEVIFGEPRRGGKRHCLSFISSFPSPCRSRKDLRVSLFRV